MFNLRPYFPTHEAKVIRRLLSQVHHVLYGPPVADSVDVAAARVIVDDGDPASVVDGAVVGDEAEAGGRLDAADGSRQLEKKV